MSSSGTSSSSDQDLHIKRDFERKQSKTYREKLKNYEKVSDGLPKDSKLTNDLSNLMECNHSNEILYTTDEIYTDIKATHSSGESLLNDDTRSNGCESELIFKTKLFIVL